MLATKINGFNQTNKYNISKQINKQVSFKEREDEFSQSNEEEQKPNKNLIIALGIAAAAAILVFAFKKPIGKFLSGGEKASKFNDFDSKLIKNIEKKDSLDSKRAIKYVLEQVMDVEKKQKGANVKGKLMLLSKAAKEQCKIPEENIGIALGYSINGGEPIFTKIVNCKELLGIEAFKSLGKDGILTLF